MNKCLPNALAMDKMIFVNQINWHLCPYDSIWNWNKIVDIFAVDKHCIRLHSIAFDEMISLLSHNSQLKLVAFAFYTVKHC